MVTHGENTGVDADFAAGEGEGIGLALAFEDDELPVGGRHVFLDGFGDAFADALGHVVKMAVRGDFLGFPHFGKHGVGLGDEAVLGEEDDGFVAGGRDGGATGEGEKEGGEKEG